MKQVLITLLVAFALMAAGPVVAGAVFGSVLAGAGSGEVAIAGAVVDLTSSTGAAASGAGGGSIDDIPLPMLATYQAAATVCPGLSWATLAAIGTIESGNGQSTLAGVHSGHNSAGAEGPMQFEPATFERYDLPVPPGGAAPPSPYDPVDAAYAAARMLCANGVTAPGGLSRAIFDYNHSTAYVEAVLQVAGRLERAAAAAVAGSGPAPAVPMGTTGAASRGRTVRLVPDRHPVSMGWRDSRGGLRLLGPGASGLAGRRGATAAGRPAAIRGGTGPGSRHPPPAR